MTRITNVERSGWAAAHVLVEFAKDHGKDHPSPRTLLRRVSKAARDGDVDAVLLALQPARDRLAGFVAALNEAISLANTVDD